MDDWVEDQILAEGMDPDRWDNDDPRLEKGPLPQFDNIFGTVKYKTITKNKKGDPKIIFQIVREKGFHSEPDIIETVATVRYFKAADEFDEGDYIYCVTVGPDGTVKNMIEPPDNHGPIKSGFESRRRYHW